MTYVCTVYSPSTIGLNRRVCFSHFLSVLLGAQAQELRTSFNEQVTQRMLVHNLIKLST